MYLLLGIVSTLCHNFARYNYEQGMKSAPSLPARLYFFYGETLMLGLMLVIFFFVGEQAFYFHPGIALLYMFGAALLSFFAQLLMFRSYKHVKFSQLVPYEQVDLLLTIILGAVLFWNKTQLDDVVFALLAIFVVIIFNVINRSHASGGSIGKGQLYFLAAKSLMAIRGIAAAYIVVLMTVGWYTVLSVLCLVIINFSGLLLSQDRGQLIHFGKENAVALRYRLFDKLFFAVTFVIGAFILQKMGVVFSTLLIMVGYFIRLFVITFLFKETIQRNDIITGIIVILCVLGGVLIQS